VKKGKKATVKQRDAFRFTPADFEFVDMTWEGSVTKHGPGKLQARRLANAANEKLREWLRAAPETNMDEDLRVPDNRPRVRGKFVGKIVCIREVKRR
jgi:hypothetical protein